MNKEFRMSCDDDDDNMRGWDPASEDDTHDNGMDRWSENNDEKIDSQYISTTSALLNDGPLGSA